MKSFWMILILRMVTGTYGILYDFDISHCKCIPQNSPCAKKGLRINFNFARMPSACLPNLFLCCDEQLESLGPKGNFFSRKIKESFNRIVNGQKSDGEKNKTEKTKLTKFHRPQNIKVPLLFQKEKYHQESENNPAKNRILNTKFSKVSQKDFTAIHNSVPVIPKGIIVDFTNDEFNLRQDTRYISREKTPNFLNRTLLNLHSNNVTKLDSSNENLFSGLNVTDVKQNINIKNEHDFSTINLFPSSNISETKLKNYTDSQSTKDRNTVTNFNINLNNAILSTKDLTKNISDYTKEVTYDLQQNDSQNAVKLKETYETEAPDLLKDATNISFSEANSKSEETERNKTFELVTLSNTKTDNQRNEEINPPRATPLPTKADGLSIDIELQLSEGPVNFSSNTLLFEDEFSGLTPLPEHVEYSSFTPLPEDVEYSSFTPLPEDVEYSSFTPLPEDVEYSSFTPLPEDVEYSSFTPLPEDVEHSSFTPLPEDVEYSSFTPLPEDVEYSSFTPLPEDVEYSSFTPLHEDVDFTTDTLLPEDVDFTTDTLLPEDVDLTTDTPLHKDVDFTTDTSLHKDVEVYRDATLPEDVEFYSNTQMSEEVVLHRDKTLPEVLPRGTQFPEDMFSSVVVGLSDETQSSEEGVFSINTPLSEEVIGISIDTPLSEDAFSSDSPLSEEKVGFSSDVPLFKEVVEISSYKPLDVVSDSMDVNFNEIFYSNTTETSDETQSLDVQFESTTLINDAKHSSTGHGHKNKLENISNKNFSLAKSKLETRTRAKSGEIIDFDNVYFKQPKDGNKISNEFSFIYTQRNKNSSEVVQSVKPRILPPPISIINGNSAESEESYQTRINGSHIKRKYLDRLLTKEKPELKNSKTSTSKKPTNFPNNLGEVTENFSSSKGDLEGKHVGGNLTSILLITRPSSTLDDNRNYESSTEGSQMNEAGTDNSILNWVFNIFN